MIFLVVVCADVCQPHDGRATLSAETSSRFMSFSGSTRARRATWDTPPVPREATVGRGRSFSRHKTLCDAGSAAAKPTTPAARETLMPPLNSAMNDRDGTRGRTRSLSNQFWYTGGKTDERDGSDDEDNVLDQTAAEEIEIENRRVRQARFRRLDNEARQRAASTEASLSSISSSRPPPIEGPVALSPSRQLAGSARSSASDVRSMWKLHETLPDPDPSEVSVSVLEESTCKVDAPADQITAEGSNIHGLLASSAELASWVLRSLSDIGAPREEEPVVTANSVEMPAPATASPRRVSLFGFNLA